VVALLARGVLFLPSIVQAIGVTIIKKGKIQMATKIATKSAKVVSKPAKASVKVNASKTVEHRSGSWAHAKSVKVELPGNGATITVLTKPDDTVYSKLEQASKLALYRKLKSGVTLGGALETIEGLTKGQIKRFAQWGYIKFSKVG